MVSAYDVQITMKTIVCGGVISLLVIAQLMLPSAAAPSVASLVNQRGSFSHVQRHEMERLKKMITYCTLDLGGHRLCLGAWETILDP